MAIKFIILLSVVMYASAGHLAAVPAAGYATTYTAAAPAYHSVPLAYSHSPAYGTSSQQVIRSYDGTVSQYAKAVDTPFSSVRKHDTRITNNLYTPSLVSYAAPAAHHVTYAAPAAHHVSYAAPAAHHVSYATPAAHHVSYAAPAAHQVTYATPAAAHGYAHSAPHYSHATSVAHVSFDGLGAHYAW